MVAELGWSMAVTEMVEVASRGCDVEKVVEGWLERADLAKVETSLAVLAPVAASEDSCACDC